eukprot:g33237.t1
MDRLDQVKRRRARHGLRLGVEGRDFVAGEVNIKAIGLYASKAKYQVFLQFTFGLTLTVEEAKDGHVARGVGGAIKMDGTRKFGLVVACRAQMLYKPVPESAFSLRYLLYIGETNRRLVDWFKHLRCARNNQPDLLVTIHFNSSSQPPEDMSILGLLHCQ